MGKPAENEYPSYYHTYVSLIDSDNIISFLKTQREYLIDIFKTIPDAKANYAYAERKWSIKEVLCHINDTERIFAYRALRFARADEQALSGFDENIYVENSNTASNSLSNLIEEFSFLRLSHIPLFSTFDTNTCSRKGIANGKEISVNALLYIIAGHAEHHKNILLNRYLNK